MVETKAVFKLLQIPAGSPSNLKLDEASGIRKTPAHSGKKRGKREADPEAGAPELPRVPVIVDPVREHETRPKRLLTSFAHCLRPCRTGSSDAPFLRARRNRVLLPSANV